MREDITMIPEMETAGWKPVYNHQDILHKRLNCPNHEVGFQKGNIRVWKLYWYTSQGVFSGWQKAELIDGYYTNHLYSPNAMNNKGRENLLPDLKTIIARF